MPVSWRISDGLLWLESDGVASFEEWREAVEAALRHPDHRPGLGVVHDWRRLRVAPEAEQLHARASYAGRLGARRWAVVVDGRAGYGMGRMAEILTEPKPVELRVFQDIGEAEAWARGK